MMIFFSSRDKARAATFGKFIDNGPNAAKGKRFARRIHAISGNAAQRRKQMRVVLRNVV